MRFEVGVVSGDRHREYGRACYGGVCCLCHKMHGDESCCTHDTPIETSPVAKSEPPADFDDGDHLCKAHNGPGRTEPLLRQTDEELWNGALKLLKERGEDVPALLKRAEATVSKMGPPPLDEARKRIADLEQARIGAEAEIESLRAELAASDKTLDALARVIGVYDEPEGHNFKRGEDDELIEEATRVVRHASHLEGEALLAADIVEKAGGMTEEDLGVAPDGSDKRRELSLSEMVEELIKHRDRLGDEAEKARADLAAEKVRRGRADVALAQALIDWAEDRATVTADRDRLLAIEREARALMDLNHGSLDAAANCETCTRLVTALEAKP